MNSHSGYFGPAIIPALRHLWRIFSEPEYRIFQGSLRRFCAAKKSACKTISIGSPFSTKVEYIDASSMRSMWEIIMCQKVYDIGPVDHEPWILDCGANIGLAQLYWKNRYQSFKSIAWEPDPAIAAILGHNLHSWQLPTEKRAFALSDVEEEVSFYSDGSDGGHISGLNVVDCAMHNIVRTERLGPFLSPQIDLLKIDIEGGEHKVLNDVRDQLGVVQNIFIEFHLRNEDERLSDLLSIIESARFSYRIEDRIPKWKSPPFLDAHEFNGRQLRHGHIYCKKIPPMKSSFSNWPHENLTAQRQ